MGLFGTNIDLSGFGSTDSTTTSNNTLGDGANAALDAAASAIPFGALAKNFLDSLGLQENIDLVFKYGLSSWGASTDPDKMKGFFAETVWPWVQIQFDSIEGSNAQQVINKMDSRLRANMYYYQALRDNHSKAGSTREANDWAQAELAKLCSTIANDMVAQFAAKGIKINKEISKVPVSQMGLTSFINDTPFTGRDLDTYVNKQYFHYTIDASSFKNVAVDEMGQVVSKNGNGMLMGGLTLAALGFFWIKGMKKLK